MNGLPSNPRFPGGVSTLAADVVDAINAENPETFAPSAGLITKFIPPSSVGVRVDTAAYSGWFVPPYYDSLVAKLITQGHDRTEAIARMQRALEMFVVEGIHTSIPLQQRIIASTDDGYRKGLDVDSFALEYCP